MPFKLGWFVPSLRFRTHNPLRYFYRSLGWDGGEILRMLRLGMLLSPNNEHHDQCEQSKSGGRNQSGQITHRFFPSPFPQSSGVIHVPAANKMRITTTVKTTNPTLNRPVTNWPTKAIDIRNSTVRPNMAATYRRLALLSFTNQDYHVSTRRSTCR